MLSSKPVEKCYQPNFCYTHSNPYHEKLDEFQDFLLKDREGEIFQGKWQSVFSRKAPLVLEIGSGYGHFLQQYCLDYPQENIVGMDYRFKRSFNLAKKLQKANVTNLKFLRAKAERIGYLFEDNELDKVFYFFPDPWPKKRHHKKRLIQPHFLNELDRVLSPTGKVFIKTDHRGYASSIEEQFDKHPGFKQSFSSRDLWGIFDPENPIPILQDYKTKFEKIFLQKNEPIAAFIYEKVSS